MRFRKRSLQNLNLWLCRMKLLENQNLWHPIAELRAIPGVDSAALATFETDALAAAEASVALKNVEDFVAANTPPPSPPPSPPSPPPPSPPPNRLVAYDYDSAAPPVGVSAAATNAVLLFAVLFQLVP